MNEAIEEPTSEQLTVFLHGGPLQLLIVLLIVAVGAYHFILLIRSLMGRHTPVSSGFHAILLFAPSCLLVLSVAALLPTTFPGLFVVGIDEDQALKYELWFASLLGSLCLTIFIPNLILSLFALNRAQRNSSRGD